MVSVIYLQSLIVGINVALVFAADKSFGAIFWVFFFIPAANVVLGGLLVGLRSAVSVVFGGVRVWLYVVTSTALPIAAIFVDGRIIISMVHGC